jgi:8-oxo-dGTP pyrophosphatase MutT (NUDIX family)
MTVLHIASSFINSILTVIFVSWQSTGGSRSNQMVISHTARKRMLERIRVFFGGLPCRVQAAALPWRVGENGVEIMLVTSRGTGRWVLPKGWPESDEPLNSAAAREAAEEAGLSGAVAVREIGRFYYGKQLPSGLQWRCEVHVFPLEVERVADKWPERKKRMRGWFSPAEAAARVNEPDLGELIASFSVDPRKIAA